MNKDTWVIVATVETKFVWFIIDTLVFWSGLTRTLE